ncbi:MAG: hypothetical protein L0Y72_00555 [Gemmataceae bacterium]|nr:hypothetical protein [Gemmataceae bacterium]MCI0737500.1 hypothetical protein [Gemmataceae bacterium]
MSNPLQRRLASLRRRFRLLVGWRGLCAIAAVLIGAGVVVGLADWFLNLPSLFRALLLVGIVASAGVVAFRLLIQPLARPSDDLSLALQVEGVYPELNDALASTVQFLQLPADDPKSGSAAMRQAAITRALNQTESYDFGKILDRRGMLWLTAAALVSVLAAGHFLYHHTQFAQVAFWRLADPFGHHTWTQIQVQDTPHRIAQGQPFLIKAKLDGIVPNQARVEIDGALRTEKTIAVKRDDKKRGGAFLAAVDMTQQKGKFRFRIHANDAVYPPGRGQWHEVEVLPPPKFAMLDGLPSPQIELRFPDYTDLEPAKLSPGSRHIEAILGTHVSFRAAVDRPLESAELAFRSENSLVNLAAQLSPVMHSLPFNTLGSLGTQQAVNGSVSARFENDQLFNLDFVPWVTGPYVLRLRDKLGLIKDYEIDTRVNLDPLPAVQLVRPATSQSVLPDAEVAFKMLVSDETFAIRSVFVEFRRKNAEGKWIDDEPVRLPLYDYQVMGRVIPQLSASLHRQIPGFVELKLRPKELDILTHWALKNRFKEGESIILQIGADDFCDIFRARQPGRSHEIELRIVGKAEIARILDDGLAQAQQELVRVQQMQEEALNLVKDLLEKKKEGKITQKELDQLIEAEQIQKQIQERLGQRPDEGLRNELNKLQQMIKDNKLPSSETQDLIKTLKNELERLAQEDLQQIEPNLAEARKELSGTTKPTPKKQSSLEKASELQQQSKKTLDDLAKFLDPWASMHMVKGKTRDLLNKQNELKNETQQIQKKQDELAGKPSANAKDRKDAEEKLGNDLGKKSDAQNSLAQRAEDLLKMMNEAQAKRAKDGDKDGADRLKQAAKIGEQNMLPDQMREAGKSLGDKNKLNDAMNKQTKAAKDLEKMLAALEGKKEDDLERLQKKQKNAADVRKDIDQLAKDQDRLQKKVRDAQKMENPEERDRELKRLAKEQQALEEKAREKARELARLQEEQASRAMNRAAQEMDRAADKLNNGENPEENQQEALDRIEDAQAKLQEFEEELAREQLAKIADRIKGLKERQDAFLDRSKELQERVMKHKKWSFGLLDTLDGDITSQQGLAGETRSLKEKIKEAKVFEHIFEKAAKAMEEAAKSMEERKAVGKERRLDFEKEELTDEVRRSNEVQKLQSQAAQRLQRLLDALKNDPNEVAQNGGQKKDDGGGGQQEGPKTRPGDGIPPMAQLKALRSEQVEVNERTKEFAQQNPDVNNLTEAQRREASELEVEQRRIHELFQQMLQQKENKGEPQ